MTLITAEDQVLEIVRKFATFAKQPVQLTSTLSEDLQLDSLDRYELATAVEDELFSVWLGSVGSSVLFDAESEIFAWVDVGDVARSVTKHLEAFRRTPRLYEPNRRNV